MDQGWLEQLCGHPELLRMGHMQRAEDRNLGLGWLYYALARILRPRTVVCIGSWRGFVPLVLARGLRDNLEGGEVTFIDPSLVDGFWEDPVRTTEWFKSFDLENIYHYRMTTQDFAASVHNRALRDIGLLFVDGYHSAEQARFDHETFADRLTADAMVLFHDSIATRPSSKYGPDRIYEHTVKHYIDGLKRRPDLQVMDFPFASGVTLVRGSRPAVT
jgi:predicted O-methyltransferase YrrM